MSLIKITNCNNIDSAVITIKKGALNIKYGLNGLGKSTISKAIVGSILNDGTLEQLIPFKNRGKINAEPPSVEGVAEFKSALIFDESYVNQFAFQQDEVVKNSFEIFIKNKDYDASIAEIDKLLDGIKKVFSSDTTITKTIADLKELSNAFGSSATDTIHKSCKIYKALGSGNKIENVSTQLKPFEAFIKSDKVSKWITWQIEGNNFLGLGNNCPYCSTVFYEESQKDTAKAVKEEYNAIAIKHLNDLIALIEQLGKYFSTTCRTNLATITHAKIALTDPELSFLSGLKTDIDALIKKLTCLHSISFFSLSDVDDILNEMNSHKINLKMIDKLNSEETRKITDSINNQLDKVITEIGNLKGALNKHKDKIKKIIDDNNNSINTFLKQARYKYTVEIVPEPNSYKMKLTHSDLNEHIKLATTHLSYGEKNAFALVLFMHQVLSENPDIVVLDDPISSFDKNKKFAILHELFVGKASLKEQTTIMLTHDIEPVIDVLKSVSSVFKASNTFATFLTSNNGQIKETPILHTDIQTFAEICSNNIEGSPDPIIKVIYLRRHYEILGEKAKNEYHLLSSLLKRRVVPTRSKDENDIMPPTEKKKAETTIKKRIPGFSYDTLIKHVQNTDLVKEKFFSTKVSYEKIQLFRIISKSYADLTDPIFTKFMNESYHIENEYVMQLNPNQFDNVPDYIVQKCAEMLKPPEMN